MKDFCPFNVNYIYCRWRNVKKFGGVEFQGRVGETEIGQGRKNRCMNTLEFGK